MIPTKRQKYQIKMIMEMTKEELQISLIGMFQLVDKLLELTPESKIKEWIAEVIENGD